MKTNDKDTFKVPEKSSYKKRFLVRKQQEHEAEALIKHFKEVDEDCPDESRTPPNERK